MTANTWELKPDELAFSCDPSQFEFETTDDLPNLLNIIGQDRAVRAIDFGVSIPSYGFNVYVMGPSGTGKTTTVQKFLKDLAEREAAPSDICYVNNFKDGRRPLVLLLPAGKGVQLKQDVADFVREMRLGIPAALDSDDFDRQTTAITEAIEEERNKILAELETVARENDFGLVQSATGLGLVPVKDGKMLSPEEYQKLTPQDRQAYEAKHSDLQEHLNRSLRALREVEKSGQEKLGSLARKVADSLIGEHLRELEEEYADFDDITAFLKALRDDMVDNVAAFRPEGAEADSQEAASERVLRQEFTPDPMRPYQVNVIVDHSRSKGAPVVFETNPNYYNLVGRIEQEFRFGVMTTDFTQIQAGSLHRANGGYLVINARDLLEYPLSWKAVERTIKNQEIRTEMIPEAMPIAATTTLEPQCVPFNAKVILIGDWSTYSVLYELDEDFRKFFKIRADFNAYMDRTPETMHEYAQFIAARVRQDGLIPFDRSAVAKVIETGSRLVEDKAKLSTRFASVVEIIHEASFWAGRNGRATVTAEDVEKTIEERRYRAGHVQEQMQREILEGTIHVETEGDAVGQVNGLSIIEIADYEFGLPTRISAKTYMGKGNVVAIDREANLTGNIHNKGLLILQGFFGARFARKKNVSLSASLTFEQSYSRIDGDSASSTELYALLSSLSGVAIRQNLAVTGSVDQDGQVQAIGGASAKIEGFFDICQQRGLTGNQGVIIPRANVPHLMLRKDVIQAVEEGDFHVYAVETIDEGIELLTGTPAGEPDADDVYPADSINYLVQRRLREMTESREEAKHADLDEDDADEDALLAPADTVEESLEEGAEE